LENADREGKMKPTTMFVTLPGILLLLAASALADEPPLKPAATGTQSWTTGVITYDGAGNIKSMASAPETYTYDGVSRLVSGTAGGAGNHQDYKYDLYGNRVSSTTTGSGCVSGTDCQEDPVTIDPATNRITSNSAQYDTSGNLTAIDSLYTYSWDGAGMMTEQVASRTHYQYVYDANDERIAIYTPSAKTWQFTLRDPAHNVIREVTAAQSSGTWTWTWNRDHVYRGSQILATVTATDTQHFHLDHLGTPRIVTNAGGQLIGTHTYYPFGTALAEQSSTESPLESHKFTGHERDATNALSIAHTLDYMHARYYSPMLGRFLAVDPDADLEKNKEQPQRWNRYAYVSNDPLTFTDPTGREQRFNPGSYDWSGYLKRVDKTVSFVKTAVHADDIRAAASGMGPSASISENAMGATVILISLADVGSNFVEPGKGAIEHGVEAIGFKSFAAFKRMFGAAGEHMEWHHIVEQTGGNVARFGSEAIHNNVNIVRLDEKAHRAISAYYSSKQSFTGEKLCAIGLRQNLSRSNTSLADSS
jgi:RHS repeat-associated protein